ncbi:hypothetical protein GCM10027605_26040 [Micromonospora zhanjiangensis]
MQAYLWTIAAALGAAAIALLVVQTVHRIVRALGRRSVLLAELAQHAHRPFQVAATVFAVQAAVRIGTGLYAVGTGWRQALLHGLVLLTIATTAWLVASLLLVCEDIALVRFRTDVPNNRQARRIRTQINILRRLTVVIIVVLALGVMLMTYPAVRGVGASVLASAGVIGALAALAAQSVLANLFAGLQLAFGGAVRLDDVVVVEGSGAGSRNSPSATWWYRSGTTVGWSCPPRTSPPSRSRTGPGPSPRCSAPPSSTSTGRSRCRPCGRNCAAWWRTPSSGTAGSACCR